MLCVGLTGGIASGKSLAAEIFEKCGARLIDADAVSREAVVPGSKSWERVVAHFGRSILKADGSIDRQALGDIVFSDAAERQKLNVQILMER